MPDTDFFGPLRRLQAAVAAAAVFGSFPAVADCTSRDDELLTGLLLPDLAPGCVAFLPDPRMPAIAIDAEERSFRSAWSARLARLARPGTADGESPRDRVEVTLFGFVAAAETAGTGPGGLPPASLDIRTLHLAGAGGRHPTFVRAGGTVFAVAGRELLSLDRAILDLDAAAIEAVGQADLRALLSHPSLDEGLLPEGTVPFAIAAETRMGEAGEGATLFLRANADGIGRLAIDIGFPPLAGPPSSGDSGAPPARAALPLDILARPVAGFRIAIALDSPELAATVVALAEARTGANLGLLSHAVAARLASADGIVLLWEGAPVAIRDLPPAALARAAIAGLAETGQ